MRIHRFDRFGKALRVIRKRSRHIETQSFESLQKLPGIITIFRLGFVRHQDAVMLILDHHHTVVRTHGVVTVYVAFCHWLEDK